MDDVVDTEGTAEEFGRFGSDIFDFGVVDGAAGFFGFETFDFCTIEYFDCVDEVTFGVLLGVSFDCDRVDFGGDCWPCTLSFDLDTGLEGAVSLDFSSCSGSPMWYTMR